MESTHNIPPGLSELITDLADRLSEAVEEVRALRQDRDAAEDAVLTLQEVLALVPWSRPTVMEMIKRRRIPMVKVEGKWIITRRAFREAADRHFEAPKGVRIKTRA